MLKPDTEFYAEWDEETATYCVFDTEDGKAWSSWASLEQAEKNAEKRTRNLKISMGVYNNSITVDNLQRLLNGEEISVLNGKGKIVIDPEVNLFLALLSDDFALDLHNTLEGALNQIRDWNE